MLNQMQKFFIKNIVELEFGFNLGEPGEQSLFYSALKKLLDDVELNLDEQNSLGNIIYRQYYNPATCLKGTTLTELDKKEASLLFRANLLICLLQQFNKPDEFIQQPFDLNWFIQQRDKLVNEAKTQLPFSFDLGNSIHQSPLFYTRCVPLFSALIAFSPLLYYRNDEKTLEDFGLPVDSLINCLTIAFVLCLASAVSLAQVPSYYWQSNTFFKEQKSIEINFKSIIKELNTLIENYNDKNAELRSVEIGL
ncbi:hypothetical protein ACQUW5_06835 [Legionella sp. CNM-1927-20]|uniref:hypothetical protein n=1 Tax=Legionella sp. CNM-1927-20 TaxID=3422221 RepID=UPI00403ACC56